MTINVDRETDTQRIGRCDHDGTTELLDGLTPISHCAACGKTWPSRFGAGAPTMCIVDMRAEAGVD